MVVPNFEGLPGAFDGVHVFFYDEKPNKSGNSNNQRFPPHLFIYFSNLKKNKWSRHYFKIKEIKSVLYVRVTLDREMEKS
jgi:hypothetical protein